MFSSKDEIKIALYTYKPSANFMKADAAGLHYHARIDDLDIGRRNVYFTIPYSDAATGNFYPQMEQGQHLARWIDDPNS